MTITIEPLENADIVRVSGRLDRQAGLESLLAEKIERGRRWMVVDLAQVDFIDSSGVGAVVSAWKRCAKTDGKLVLLNPSPRASEVLALAGLDRLLEVFESEDEALRAFG